VQRALNLALLEAFVCSAQLVLVGALGSAFESLDAEQKALGL
jgi:hypothetical protein